MAKTYTTVGWQDGEIVTPAKADLTTGIVTPAEVNGTTPVNAENLRHMDDAIKQLYDEGTTSKDIVIGSEEDATEDTKILIETDSFNCLGTEVVNSLEGNENDKAPSVEAVNNAINNIIKLSNDSFITINSAFSIKDNNLHRQGKHVSGYITILKNSKFKGTIEEVGKLIKPVVSNYNLFGVSSNNPWTIPSNFAYVYLSANSDGTFLTFAGNTNDTVLKVYLDYLEQ